MEVTPCILRWLNPIYSDTGLNYFSVDEKQDSKTGFNWMHDNLIYGHYFFFICLFQLNQKISAWLQDFQWSMNSRHHKGRKLWRFWRFNRWSSWHFGSNCRRLLKNLIGLTFMLFRCYRTHLGIRRRRTMPHLLIHVFGENYMQIWLLSAFHTSYLKFQSDVYFILEFWSNWACNTTFPKSWELFPPVLIGNNF